MFRAFFPKPKWFFLSAVLWFIFNLFLWFYGGKDWGTMIGFAEGYSQAELPIGLTRIWSPQFLWFYIWYIGAFAIFSMFWRLVARHPWHNWSIWGSAFIIFNVWFGVQTSVNVNAWYNPFYNLIQDMMSQGGGDINLLYQGTLTFLYIAMVHVTVAVINLFFVSHYIFRWRTAMNQYYTAHWAILRTIEGASQRVQEDTMRFATTLEALGVSFIRAILTLIAFLPILVQLSSHVPSLPVIGELQYSLVWAAVLWALFGTIVLVLVGIKLPGLEFNNQKVEAAYRKELVYGEDHSDRAQPKELKSLFKNVRFNYFRIYFHYAYFNLVSIWYSQLDNIFGIVMLFPSIAGGLLTLGLFMQITNIFGKVREAFQYLVDSWKTIIELLSIYKRLKAFESILHSP
ncbi:peptide antibiotic transporter SbmA [Acinetobacter larvae]|uniref:Peptide transporter n=1 Tax=Acinetobacter larvae TaxID=1789224 RepID=A0A1B2LX52_9GAMM|nr:peptide antibiotic transporter SbmA [Acinetobacter larvae]AOA57524.1 peptide transporter [Acinetobacter larvae]